MFFCMIFELTSLTEEYNIATAELDRKGLSPWVRKRGNMDKLVKYQRMS